MQTEELPDPHSVIEFLHAMNRHDLSKQLTLERLQLIKCVSSMAKALKLVLLFHGAAPWTEELSKQWKETTGEDDATTRVLCDHVRKVLGEVP